MRRLVVRLIDRVELAALKQNEVARIDGIGVADMRLREDQRDPFRQIVSESMRLVREHDPRRYRRIKCYIKWIVNRVRISMGAGGAGYHPKTRICNIELLDFRNLDRNVLAAYYACVLVHEATHGAIESRGVVSTEGNRARIERLCTAEENRFAAKLAKLDPDRYPARLLHQDFDERQWQSEWAATALQRRRAFLARLFADMKAEPAASRNGGPVTPASNSGVVDGPPSAS